MLVLVPKEEPHAGSYAPAAAISDRSCSSERQPAMTGLIDGSLSTLTPIFAVVLARRQRAR